MADSESTLSGQADGGGGETLVEKLQAGAAATDSAVQAVDQAAQLANAIVADIHGPETGEGPAIGSAAETLRPAVGPPAEVRRLLAIEVPIIVQLGVRRLSVGEVMRFAVGAIIEFQKSAEEELELLVNNRPIGKGQAVKVGENFGIRLSSIGSVKETIRVLGGT